MKTRMNWSTLAAAAALFAAAPAIAADGHHGAAAGGHAAAANDGGAGAAKPGPVTDAKGRRVEVTVTEKGFVPSQIPAKKGEVLNLVVTRKVERTCATELVQKDQGVNAPLPLDQPVTVTLKAPADGQLAFSCAHGHIAGKVVAY